MRRTRWVVFALVVLIVVAVTAWFVWPRKYPPQFDPQTLAAYTDRGGKYGQMGLYDGQSYFGVDGLRFLPRDTTGWIPTHHSVPAFRFEKFDGVKSVELPSLGQAIGLDLSHTGVTDGAIGEVGKLDQLTHLDLSGTPVSDDGLKHLTSLTGLTHLSLRHTRVTDVGLKHITAFTKLNYLDLSETRVTGTKVEFLAAVPNLTRLYLSNDQVTDDVLASLRGGKVHVLYLQCRQAAADAKIHSVQLSGAKLTDTGLRYLAGLTNLEFLDLGRSQVTDSGVGLLADHPKLVSLAVPETKVTAAGVKRLASSTSLKFLHLSGDQVTDDLLEALMAVHKIHLLTYRAGVGPKMDSSWQTVATDTDIKVIDLTDTRVTPEGRKWIQENMPKCLVLP